MPGPKPTNTTPRQYLGYILQCRADALKDEEPTGGAELRLAPEYTDAKVVRARGYNNKVTDEPIRQAECRAAQVCAEEDEDVPEELVLAEGPEVRDRGGPPLAIREWGKPRRGLPWVEIEDERHEGYIASKTVYINCRRGRKRTHGRSAWGRGYAQRRVEEHVAC
jgi:hypothetical protein